MIVDTRRFQNYKKMAITIAMANHKGGVGKTTSVQNLAAGLARRGYRALMVDFDPQSNLSDAFGCADPEIGIYDAMIGEAATPIVKISENLDLVPSHIGLATADIQFSTKIGREKILDGLLNKIRDNYDYIFIDCPPSLGLLTINAFSTANEIYIPLDAEYFSMRGLDSLQELISEIQQHVNPSLKIGGVFFTKFDPRQTLKKDVEVIIRERFGALVYNTRISNNEAVAEAQAQGIDVFEYNKRAKASKEYDVMVEEMLSRYPVKVK